MIILSLVLIFAYDAYSFRSVPFQRSLTSTFTLSTSNNFIPTSNDKQPSWLIRDEEEVIIKDGGYSIDKKTENSLFDALYRLENEMGENDDSSTGIASLSLRDLSEAYQFSQSFLGDFVIQMGCKPPIDVDTPIKNFLTSEMIYTLMEAVTSLDPLESNIDFDSVSAGELADSLNIKPSTLINICEQHSLNLPFGLDTVLHKACVAKIISVYENDDYEESSPETDETTDIYVGKDLVNVRVVDTTQEDENDPN